MNRYESIKVPENKIRSILKPKIQFLSDDRLNNLDMMTFVLIDDVSGNKS